MPCKHLQSGAQAPNHPAPGNGAMSFLPDSDVIGAPCLSRGVRQLMNSMRFTRFALLLAALTGCSRDDARLHGTWRSNRDATVAAAFQRDPRWTNAPPQKVEHFRDMFGHMTVTYSNCVGSVHNRDETYTFHYRVVGRSPGHVAMRDDSPMDMGRDIRIRFENGNTTYWIDTGPLGFGLEERFDKIQNK
jgi:hypothetical protein